MRNKLKTTEDLTKQEIYDIIRDYIDSIVDVSLREMRDNNAFDKPAWSEHQAYQLGFQKACVKLREFIPTSDQGAKN